MNTVITALMAIVFGLGVSLTILGLSLQYKLFFTDDPYQSIFIVVLSFIFVWVGFSLLSFVIW